MAKEEEKNRSHGNAYVRDKNEANRVALRH